LLLGDHLAPFSSSAALFLKSVFFVGFTVFVELDPIRPADGARRIQARHSGEMISTTFGKFFRPGCGRSVILM
jgi:hypothetical protein